MSGRGNYLHTRKVPAVGVRRSGPCGKVVVVVRMDTDVFAEVRERASRAGHSMAEEIRTLIQWGLDSEDEA